MPDLIRHPELLGPGSVAGVTKGGQVRRGKGLDTGSRSTSLRVNLAGLTSSG